MISTSLFPSKAIYSEPLVSERNRKSTHAHWPTPSKAWTATRICQQLAWILTEKVTNTGWILMIAPPAQISKALLSHHNIATNRILMFQQNQVAHFDNMVRDALTSSTCSAVLCFLPEGDEKLADYAYLSEKYGTCFYNLPTEQDVPAVKVNHH